MRPRLRRDDCRTVERLFEQRRTPTRGGVPHFFKGMRRVPPVIGRELADGRTWDEMWAAPVADIVAALS